MTPSRHRPARPVPPAASLGCSGVRARIAVACVAMLAGVCGPAGWPQARAQAGAACDPAGDPQQRDACAVRDFQQADIRLSIRYREVMESLPAAGERIALRQQQRQWLRARETDCRNGVRRHEGGSAWALAYYGCLEQATRRRIGELDRPTIPSRP